MGYSTLAPQVLRVFTNSMSLFISILLIRGFGMGNGWYAAAVVVYVIHWSIKWSHYGQEIVNPHSLFQVMNSFQTQTMNALTSISRSVQNDDRKEEQEPVKNKLETVANELLTELKIHRYGSRNRTWPAP